jgi:hypothetical protein
MSDLFNGGKKRWINKYNEWEDIERSYQVKRIRSGQIRRYGPEIGSYIVTDLSGERTEEEVLDYCTTIVERATKTIEHSLRNHMTKFEKIDDNQWQYETRREWDG